MNNRKSRWALALSLSVGLALTGMAGRASAQDGPIRMARIMYLKGEVDWRPAAQASWAVAGRNLPLRQGAQLWAHGNATVAIQFDDGSRLRLSHGVITLQTLYSDTQGEFTEITENQGLSYLILREPHSIYQVNTPFASVKAVGPATVRIGANNAVDVAVRQGSAVVDGSQGECKLKAGEYIGLHNANSPYVVRDLPPPDSWDKYNLTRDSIEDKWHSSNVPPDVAIASDDLDGYGGWRDDPQYGHVWYPHESPDWRPYYDGDWCWVEPYGWTWVGNEPWGWAPYHYGTWCHTANGWGWCPGPAAQYWSPGVVSFSYGNGGVAWCPLAPGEVVYPSALSVGFSGGNWSLFFSIGGAACYYPGARAGFFDPYPWHANYVNRFGYVNNFRTINAFNRNAYIHNGYVPFNARGGRAGAVFASTAAFGARGRSAYRALPAANANSFFAHGKMVGAPARGANPVAGPPSAHVTAASFAPSRAVRTNMRLPQSVANRSVYRAPLDPRISHASAPMTTRAIAARTTPAAHITRAPAAASRVTPAANRAAANHPAPAAARAGKAAPVNPAARAAANARRSLGMPAGPAGRKAGITGAAAHAHAAAHPGAVAHTAAHPNAVAHAAAHPKAAVHAHAAPAPHAAARPHAASARPRAAARAAQPHAAARPAQPHAAPARPHAAARPNRVSRPSAPAPRASRPSGANRSSRPSGGSQRQAPQRGSFGGGGGGHSFGGGRPSGGGHPSGPPPQPHGGGGGGHDRKDGH